MNVSLCARQGSWQEGSRKSAVDYLLSAFFLTKVCHCLEQAVLDVNC